MNGALVLLSPENIRQNSSKQWVCTSTDNRTLSYLKENLFFVSNEYVQKLIYDADHPNTNYNDVLLIVGTTERCSCGCSYCYELDWPKTDSLPSSDYIDWIFEYICEIMEHADNDANITIKYFGGEPLLCSNIIKEINEKINNFTNKTSKKLNIHYQMDSNCILLTRAWCKILCKRKSTKSRRGAMGSAQAEGCIPWPPGVPAGGAVCTPQV